MEHVGSKTSITDAVRRVGWLSAVETLVRDLAYALRSLRRNPGFAAVAILTLAIGIGANTAIFSVVHTLLLTPLPYAGSERVVRLMMNAPAEESPTQRPLRAPLGVTTAELADIRARTTTLSHVGRTGATFRGLGGIDDAARLRGARVSSALFGMVGVRPSLGRGLVEQDEHNSAARVIVLSHETWHRFFNGDPAVVGRDVVLDSVLGPRAQVSHTVIGVMPPGFAFPDAQTHFWLPLQEAASGPPTSGPLVARLADGATAQAASAEVESILKALRPRALGTRYELVFEHEELSAPLEPALLVFAGAVGFVLLIACVNVTNLLLARGSARRREMAVRIAVGAGRGRLMRQLLTESTLLAMLGGLGGIAIAYGGLAGFRAIAATSSRLDLAPGLAIPRLEELTIDATALAFATALCLVTGVLCGMGPALFASKSDPIRGLRGDETSPSGLGGWRGTSVRHVLIVSEVAAATMLLAIGGLLMHSFVALTDVRTGYEPEHVLTFQVSVPATRYPDARLNVFAQDVAERLARLPGIEAAAYANQLPMVNLSDTAGGLWTSPDPKRPPAPAGPDARFVSRDYFQTFGIRVVSGRGFTPADHAGAPKVLLVNQSLVRREFDGQNPIGRTVFVGRDVTPWQIVGVVDDVRQFALDREPAPQFFASLEQWSGTGVLFPLGPYFAVRSHADAATLVGSLRSTVRELDSQAAVFNVAPMADLVASTVSRPRTYAVLMSAFAGLGLLLALVGIYGVLAFSVTQRTREIGIRMSLGARRRDVMHGVLRQSLTLAAAGVLLGLVGTAAVSGYVRGLLFGITPLDPRTLVLTAVLFLLTAALASYLPARRASRVDPLVALRCE